MSKGRLVLWDKEETLPEERGLCPGFAFLETLESLGVFGGGGVMQNEEGAGL